MKGISIAIFGFLTLGVAIAAFVWVQYNALGGIREKASFADEFAFMRLEQEAVKGTAYLEGGLRIAGAGAIRDVYSMGGMCDGEGARWQCVEPDVPAKSEIMDCIGFKTNELFNDYIINAGNVSENALIYANEASEVSLSDDGGGIRFVAEGAYIEATDGESYIRGNARGIEARIENTYFISDYDALKAWTEDGVAEGMIEGALGDERVLPQEMVSETCGCGAVSCERAEDVIDDIFPCWADSIDEAVRGALDEAVIVLESDEKYFGGEVSCRADVSCVSRIKPGASETTREYHDSGICCGDECRGCVNEENVETTERICRGRSEESICEAPACGSGRADEYDSYDEIEDEEEYDDEDDVAQALSLSGWSGESTDECEMCCVLGFDMEYATDVSFTVSCEDGRGGEPIVLRADFFVRSDSRG